MEQLLLEDSARGKMLRVKGSLTIEHACTLRDLLVEAYDKADRLDIDVQGITAVDLACIQVFCAAYETFTQAGKHMGLTAEPPEALNKALFAAAAEPASCGMVFNSERT